MDSKPSRPSLRLKTRDLQKDTLHTEWRRCKLTGFKGEARGAVCWWEFERPQSEKDRGTSPQRTPRNKCNPATAKPILNKWPLPRIKREDRRRQGGNQHQSLSISCQWMWCGQSVTLPLSPSCLLSPQIVNPNKSFLPDAASVKRFVVEMRKRTNVSTEAMMSVLLKATTLEVVCYS